MNIALVPNRDKPDAVSAAQQLSEILTRRLQTLAHPGRVLLIPDGLRAHLQEFKPNLIVVLGGDGSILTTAQALGGMPIPVVGINFGKLGYLAAYSFQEFIEHLDLILANRVPPHRTGHAAGLALSLEFGDRPGN